MATFKTIQKYLHRLRFAFLLVAMVLALFTSMPVIAAEKSVADNLLIQAKTAFAEGKRDEAVTLATQAIEADPKNPACYFLRAMLHEEKHEAMKAVLDYDQVLKLNPRLPIAWQHRGCEHFKLGAIKESIVDFDKFAELVPQQAPYLWQRGIALYYAGRFKDGRKQFESHQNVNSNDVENAVWHFLCVARDSGVEKARAALIPIKKDARVPMMQVHALFAGKATPEEVLKAAAANATSKPQLDRQLFYAHLYLGLYFDATGDETKAREHITKAVALREPSDYMGDVARVHLQLR
jgi:lipoprotein NlpI